MNFIVDKQTLEDLNMLGKYRSNSIFNIFNKTNTRGAERLLERLFAQPLSDCDEINKRSEIFRCFTENQKAFPFKKRDFEKVEQYMSISGYSKIVANGANIIQKKSMQIIASDKDYETILEGIKVTVDFLNTLKSFNQELTAAPIKERADECNELFRKLGSIPKTIDNLNIIDAIKYDHWLRGKHKETLDILIDYVYYLDMCITVAAVAKERGFCFAKAYPSSEKDNFVRIKQVWHPQLKKAVANDISLNNEKNIMFLTGANMAGKSTFMKSFAIAIYVAHMGFPVAAKEMSFTVHDGLFTSINVADNLNKGYSHYYAEVLRVKEIAQEVSNGKHLVVIFDELFKGTNVKDAFEATVVVSEAFAENRNCSYIISTHIIEAGEELRNRCENMFFVYLPTVMRGKIPEYTYKLESGITGDRHGMMIINNERIVEIIRGV